MPTPDRRTVLGERNDNVVQPSPIRTGHRMSSGKVKPKKRDSFTLRIAADREESILLDEHPPSSVAGLTDTEGEAEQTPVVKSQGKAVLRAGRMPTPESSQALPVGFIA